MTLFIRVINWNYFVIYKQFFRHHCHALQLHATLSSFTTLRVLIAYFLYSLYSIRTLGLGGASSLKPTSTLTSHLGKNVGLGDG